MGSSDSSFLLKHFCFDFDGTLIDSRQDLTRAVNAFRESIGLSDLSQQTVVDALNGEGTWQLLMETMTSADFTSIDGAIQQFLEVYEEVNTADVDPRPGVDPIIQELSSHNLAIVTNRPADMAKRMVDSAGWGEIFNRIYGIDTFDRGKPDPMPLNNLKNEWDIDSGELVMVGDSDSDIEAGHRANCKTIACTFGYGKKNDLESKNPDWMVESVDELRQLLLQ